MPPTSIVLATLNARYIHASLGLRYLRANLERHGGPDLYHASRLCEYTVQRPRSEVLEDLAAQLTPGAVLGLGVYIWNVQATFELLQGLRARRPDVVVVLGGPEVSHELDTQAVVALADYVITGWGDVCFARLCRALFDGAPPATKVIAGEQAPLQDIVLPYGELSDTDIAQRVVYVEASRGCPFRCEFCLSSLDKTAWSFDLDRVLAALEVLWQRGARNFKFVDRTFNLKLAHCQRILQFFLDHIAQVADGTLPLVHFEVIPDHLPQGLQVLLAQFPAGSLQLEVGVQSFNPQVQQRIARRQDNERTVANLRWLVQHTRAHIHADLIFGLPGEDWESFASGFDRLWALGLQEIQLGVLKRLRGTPIGRHSTQWGMEYDSAPPYTLRSNHLLAADAVQRFERLAHHWDQVANSGRFRRTVPLLLHGDAPFARWCAFSDWMHAQDPRACGVTPEQWVDALMAYAVQVLGLEPDAVRTVLLADYGDSGARGMPQCLQGHMVRRLPQPRQRRMAQRQDQHRGNAALQ